MILIEFIDNVEEAVQSQYMGQCALHDGFVPFFISIARFIEKRGKTLVGTTTIESFRLEYEYGLSVLSQQHVVYPLCRFRSP